MRVSGLRDRSKRDSSTSPADSFAGVNEKKRRRLASVGMTVGVGAVGVGTVGVGTVGVGTVGVGTVGVVPEILLPQRFSG